MCTPELLAPAGNYEAARAALAAGTDAIYVGVGNDFNARRSANNFTLEEFEAFAREAHVVGVRLYVTLNVVIKEKEFAFALKLALDVWRAGADALIIQDLGLLVAIHECYPFIECHVSTQANIHSADALDELRELGVKRVTLSRELSLEQIRALVSHENDLAAHAVTGAPIELEVFAHGALCFCYSGLCLMSSFFGGRSANRGLCAQPCRLPYKLLDEHGKELELPLGERLLCPRDVNALDMLSELSEAGVSALKLEGRMKAPDYVFSVVCAWRAEIDEVLGGGTAAKKTTQADTAANRRQQLKRAFNRDFTDSYLHGRSGNDMMSYERSNNRGELVGELVRSEILPDKLTHHKRSDGSDRLRHHTQARVWVHLDKAVGDKDLLELRSKLNPDKYFVGPVQGFHEAGETIELIGSFELEAGADVRVIRSEAAQVAVKAALKEPFVRKRALHAHIRAKIGEPLLLELAPLVNKHNDEESACAVQVEGRQVEAARTRAVTQDELAEHVGRMGNTAFELASVSCELDEGVGLAFSELHHLRTQALEELEKQLLEPWDSRSTHKGLVSGRARALTKIPVRAEVCASIPKLRLSALVSTPEQASFAQELGVSSVYVHQADYIERVGWQDSCIPVLDEVLIGPSYEQARTILKQVSHCVVLSMGGIALAKQLGVSFEVGQDLPLHNHAALDYMYGKGATSVWLSPELSLKEIKELTAHTQLPLTMVVSGRARVMTSEHCVLMATGHCISDCARCKLRSGSHYLENIDGARMPVITDINGRSRIYASQSLDLSAELSILAQTGISNFVVDTRLLTFQEAHDELLRLHDHIAKLDPAREDAPVVSDTHTTYGRNAVDAAEEHDEGIARNTPTTTGHLYKAIL